MVDNTIRNEREQRKLYLRARQRMILTGAIGFLTVALLISIPGAFGFFSSAEKTHSSKEGNFGVVTACAPQDAVLLNPSNVQLRVLNGTNKSGLGSAVAEELRHRGFMINSIANSGQSTVTPRTTIYFGKNAIDDAYTVAAEFNDAILKMDDRQDKLIDVTIGSSFRDLINVNNTAKVGSKIKSVDNCVPADKLTHVPPAAPHDPVQAKQQ